ncbi:MAG: prepilin-type N-terminal cleavage/methylation domain-containing protein [Clostridiales bacterium]|nr:prepilin-type N-terminal cleavage/methylation domain-containing protein [Clostridiales bacterium]
MKNSKKGFTLTEIIIVTAIIVILGGAAIAGIAVSIKNAKDRGDDLKNSQGENWESEAVLEVKKTKVGLGVEQIYEESADTPAPTNAASSNEVTSTPTDAPTGTPADTPATTPGSGSTGSGSGSTGTGSGSGSTGTGSGSTGTNSGSSNAGASTKTVTGSATGSGYQGSTTISGESGKKIQSVTIQAPDGVLINGCNDSSNNGKYSFQLSDDKKSATLTFTASSWTTPNTSVNLNYIQWSGGSGNLDLSYSIEYAP